VSDLDAVWEYAANFVPLDGVGVMHILTVAAPVRSVHPADGAGWRSHCSCGAFTSPDRLTRQGAVIDHQRHVADRLTVDGAPLDAA